MTNIGLEIRNVSLHEKGGKRWIQLPSKAHEKDGKTLWSAIIDFYDKNRAEQFQKSALDALDKFLVEGREGSNGF